MRKADTFKLFYFSAFRLSSASLTYALMSPKQQMPFGFFMSHSQSFALTFSATFRKTVDSPVSLISFSMRDRVQS